MYPRLCIDLKKLHHNGEKLCAAAKENGLDRLAFVTKSFCAQPDMVRALEDLPNPYLADSRVENLAAYPGTRKEKILLRLPMLSQTEDVVRHADISFCSEASVLTALDRAAGAQSKRHKVVLMVDVGDLREGVFFRNTEELLALAKQAETAENLILFGMAFNVTCYGSVIPTEETLESFRGLVCLVEDAVGHKLAFLSAGNSSSLYLLDGKTDFRGFNNLRLGESLILGRETAFGEDLPQLYGDVITLEAQLAEVKRKPSYPIGKIGVNAFGETVQYEDKGEQLRGIACVGQQDTDWSGLTPCDARISVIGASSDHLLLDLTKAEEYCVGDTVRFRLNYSALLRAFTSPYVEKVCE